MCLAAPIGALLRPQPPQRSISAEHGIVGRRPEIVDATASFSIRRLPADVECLSLRIGADDQEIRAWPVVLLEEVLQSLGRLLRFAGDQGAPIDNDGVPQVIWCQPLGWSRKASVAIAFLSLRAAPRERSVAVDRPD